MPTEPHPPLAPTDLAGLVQAIRSLAPEYGHFDVWACGRCGAPSWQQPCPSCHYYPMGDRFEATGSHTTARESWCKTARHHGGVLRWYQNCLTRGAFPNTIKRLEAVSMLAELNGASLLVEPDPETIFDEVRENEIDRCRSAYLRLRDRAVWFGFEGNFVAATRACLPDGALTGDRVEEARAWLIAATKVKDAAFEKRQYRGDEGTLGVARMSGLQSDHFRTEAAWVDASIKLAKAKGWRV